MGPSMGHAMLGHGCKPVVDHGSDHGRANRLHHGVVYGRTRPWDKPWLIIGKAVVDHGLGLGALHGGLHGGHHVQHYQ